MLGWPCAQSINEVYAIFLSRSLNPSVYIRKGANMGNRTKPEFLATQQPFTDNISHAEVVHV